MEPSPELTDARAAWIDALRARDSISVDHLRELEAHLDDTMADLEARGLTAEEAFLIATRRLGAPVPLAAEFAKAGNPTLSHHRGQWMLLGIVVYVGTVAAARVLLDLAALAWAFGWRNELAQMFLCIFGYLSAAAAGVWVLRTALRGRLTWPVIRWARRAPMPPLLLCTIAAFVIPALTRGFVQVVAARTGGVERLGYLIGWWSVIHWATSAVFFIVLLGLLYRFWRPQASPTIVAS